MGHRGQIVADEEIADPERLLQVLELIHDLRPDRHVERRDRLVERRSGAYAELRRAIPGHGVCPTDLPGEFAGYRDVPVGSSVEAVSHGLARTDSALDAGRCQ